MKKQTRFSTLSIVLLVSAFAIPAFGQTGAIKGTLVDPQGSVIADAKVMAIDESKGVVARETTTDREGSFQLLPLLRGTYTLRAEAPGFKTMERTGLVLD